jgi:hypothetical protein
VTLTLQDCIRHDTRAVEGYLNKVDLDEALAERPRAGDCDEPTACDCPDGVTCCIRDRAA